MVAKRLWAVGIVLSFVVVRPSPAAAVLSANYGRAGELAVAPALIPLPPGAVEPAGWLRDWALAAHNGLTGHLDDYCPTFRDGWKGFRVEAPDFSLADGTGAPLEQSSYWLDGLVRLGYALHDDALIQKAKARLDLVVNGVNRGGTSFIYWTSNPVHRFNSWAHSHMGRALVAWYEASGDPRVLDALVRVYRQYPVPLGNLDFAGDIKDPCPISGLLNIDAMVEAYSFSGDRRLLERARAAIAAPEVQATVNRWLKGQFTPGHAVCAYELARLPALFYLCTGEPKYLLASHNAFRWFDENHMLPYGVTSGEEYLAGIGAFRLTENLRRGGLYLVDDVAIPDRGAARVGRSHRTCAVQCRTGAHRPRFSDHVLLPVAQSHRGRLPARGTARLAGSGFSAIHLSRSSARALLRGCGQPDRANLHPAHVDGDRGPGVGGHPLWPLYRVGAGRRESAGETKLPNGISIRRDDSCDGRAEPPGVVPALLPCSKLVPVPPHRGQRSQLGRHAGQERFCANRPAVDRGDVVLLNFPMSVRIERGYETEYPECNQWVFWTFKPNEVFEKRRLPYESVHYGPLLFALPIPDRDPNTPLSGARWQYALNSGAQRGAVDARVERKSMPATWDWPLDAPIALKVPARTFDWRPTDENPLPSAPVEGDKDETIRLVPYGCTKFRISMFPVTPRAWRQEPPAVAAEPER